MIAVHPFLRMEHATIRMDRATIPVAVPPTHPLFDHRVHGTTLLPAAAAWDIALAGAAQVLTTAPAGLRQVSMRAPFLPERDAQLTLYWRDGRLLFELRQGEGTCCAGEIIVDGKVSDLGVLQTAEDRAFPPSQLYEGLARRGMEHGAWLRIVETLSLGAAHATGSLRPAPLEGAILHPGALDAAMQVAAAWLLDKAPHVDAMFIPFHVTSIEVHGGVPERAVSNVQFSDDLTEHAELIRCDVVITDDAGRPLVALNEVSFKRVQADQLTGERALPLKTVQWERRSAGTAERPVRFSCAQPPEDWKQAFAARGIDVDATTSTDSMVLFFASGGIGNAEADALRLADVARAAIAEKAAGVMVVTHGVHAIGSDDTDAAGAACLGLCQGLSDEYPAMRWQAVDLDATERLEDRLDALLQEAASTDDTRVTAWRQGQRWARSLVGMTMPRGNTAMPRRWLITGGAEGIGSLVAEHLLKSGASLVIIAGRSDEQTRLERLTALRTLGEVHYIQADVSEQPHVDALRRRVEELGGVDGIIHAAGVVRPAPFREKTNDDIRAVLTPKVSGTIHLARAFPDVQRFVCFSSLSTVMPGLGGGLVDYVAANAFLDAFCTSKGPTFQSIRWSAWAERGMASDAIVRELLEERGIKPLPTAVALSAFDHILASGAADVVVADIRAPRPRTTAGITEPLSARALEIERILQEVIAEELGLPTDEVATDQAFTALGLDSLAAFEIVLQLEDRGVGPIEPTMLFRHPTIRALAVHLGGRDTTPAPARPAVATSDGESFPLNDVQNAFYIHHRLHSGTPAYSFLRLTLEGQLDVDVLQKSFAWAEERHPMLRARFSMENGTARQRVDASTGTRGWFSVEQSKLDTHAADEHACNSTFRLEDEPPIRVRALQDQDQRTHLQLLMHHAAGDAWSLHILAEDVFHAYASLVAGRAPGRAPVTCTFRDAVALGEVGDIHADRTWWTRRLANFPSVVLPFDGDGPERLLQNVQLRADPELTEGLKRLASAHGLSLFHVMLGVQFMWLHEWTGQEHLAINVAHARRPQQLRGVERVVGCFADTLPVAMRVQSGESVLHLARRARDAWLEVQNHTAVTSVELARLLGTNDGSPRVAAPVSFSMARFPLDAPQQLPIRVVDTAGATASAATRLGLACWEANGVLQFSWNFPASLFRRETVRERGASYIDLLRGALKDRTARTDFEPIHARILAQAQRTPDTIAIEDALGAHRLREVEERSRAVAGALTSTARPHRVALLCEPGLPVTSAILGVLRAGAAWVPLDIEHPVTRLALQLDVAKVDGLVCERKTAPLAAQLIGRERTVVLEDAPPVDSLEGPTVRPDDEAYIIFTSGSTGTPKGVPITHRSMAHYLDAAIQQFGYRAGDRMAQTSSVCFDASVRQILAPLMVGATMVVLPRDITRDPERLLERVAEARLTVWSSVPSLFERLVRVMEKRGAPDLSSLRHVHLGGEALQASLLRRWFDVTGATATIANLYGPTETTINATWHMVHERPLDDALRIPIGRPLPGRRVRIVDVHGRDSDEGELHVGGIGLTPGYLGADDLNARAFTWYRSERWYRTGDRVRRLSDGTLDFLGRVDDQVKIRGYRVEPGEVESVLLRHPHVAQAAVFPDDVDGRITLVAHVSMQESATDEGELRRFLLTHLPDYMVPATIHVHDALPLTPVGKVDRSRLGRSARPAVREHPSHAEPPQTPTERHVAEVWSRVLRASVPSRDSDFFELGGDSVAVLEVFSELERHFTDLPRPTALYQARTVAALAGLIDGGGMDAPPEDVSVPLSPAQRGFLLSEGMMDQQHTWCIRLELHGSLQVEHLRSAINALVQRHPMLRTVIDTAQRPAHQRVLPEPGAFPLIIQPCGSDDEVEQVWQRERVRRFSLSEWPLMSWTLCPRAEDLHTLLITAHHIIGDAWSAQLMAGELMQAYDTLVEGSTPSLQALRSSYGSYVRWMEQRTDRNRAASWWRSAFSTPYRAPPRQPGARTPLRRRIDEEQLRLIEHEAQRQQVPMHALLQARLLDALREVTRQDDLVISTAIHGRHHPLPDLDRVVGCFATVLPIRFNGERDAAAVATRYQQAWHHAATADEISGWTDGNTAEALKGQYVFSYVDDTLVGRVESKHLRVGWDAVRSQMLHLSPYTDLFVVVRKHRRGMDVDVHGPGLSEEHAARVAEHLAMRTTRRSVDVRWLPGPPTPSMRADAALIGYLPSVPGDGSGALKELARSVLFNGRRHAVLEHLQTEMGASLYIAVPWFADELTVERSGELLADVRSAIAHAAQFGVQRVSLAGMIPSLTGYGYAVEHAAVTTGHAATTVAVVLNLQHALATRGRALHGRTLGVAGLGSIGRAALELGLRVLPHPERLLVLERRGTSDKVRAAVRELAARAGFEGAVEVLEGTPAAPGAFYDADIILGATSSPNVLDVMQLKEGAVLVDDSFPHCFDVERALHRMRTAGDVLIIGGGLVDAGPLVRNVWLPQSAQMVKDRLLAHLGVGGVAGCQVEPLMQCAVPSLPPVLGLVEPEAALRYWDAARELGLTAAPLHLGAVMLPEDRTMFAADGPDAGR